MVFLINRLEQETKRRQEAEDKLKELLDKMKFNNGVNDQVGRNDVHFYESRRICRSLTMTYLTCSCLNMIIFHRRTKI